MRRNLKIVYLFFITVCVFLGMTSCSPPTYQYDYKENKDRVSSVQLIYYNNPDVDISLSVGKSFVKNEFKSFHADRCEVIEELDSEKIDGFLMDLSERADNLSIAKTNSPIGFGLRILYNDGSFFVYTWGKTNEEKNRFLAEYNADGSIKNEGIWVGDYFYMMVAANYFGTKIELN